MVSDRNRAEMRVGCGVSLNKNQKAVLIAVRDGARTPFEIDRKLPPTRLVRHVRTTLYSLRGHGLVQFEDGCGWSLTDAGAIEAAQ